MTHTHTHFGLVWHSADKWVRAYRFDVSSWWRWAALIPKPMGKPRRRTYPKKWTANASVRVCVSVGMK